METFQLPPCKAIGEIKNAIKEAILDGIIGNNPEEARQYMFQVASELGIHKKDNLESLFYENILPPSAPPYTRGD